MPVNLFHASLLPSRFQAWKRWRWRGSAGVLSRFARLTSLCSIHTTPPESPNHPRTRVDTLASNLNRTGRRTLHLQTILVTPYSHYAYVPHSPAHGLVGRWSGSALVP